MTTNKEQRPSLEKTLFLEDMRQNPKAYLGLTVKSYITNMRHVARRLSRELHSGQVDKNGARYSIHTDAVAARGISWIEYILGQMHDLGEDQSMYFKESDVHEKYCMPKIFEDMLTPLNKSTYGQMYPWERLMYIASNHLTLRVKINDSKDNSDITRSAHTLVGENLKDRLSRCGAYTQKVAEMTMLENDLYGDNLDAVLEAILITHSVFPKIEVRADWNTSVSTISIFDENQHLASITIMDADMRIESDGGIVFKEGVYHINPNVKMSERKLYSKINQIATK